MDTDHCPKVEKCPIFLDEEITDYELSDHLRDVYKENYCTAGPSKYKTCKRFIAAEELGVPIPKIIMPNSARTVDEILEIINKTKK